MTLDFVSIITDNATFAVLLAAGLGYLFYFRQKKVDHHFQNKLRLIGAISVLLRECQSVLFILDRINYTTKFVINNKYPDNFKKEELPIMMKAEMSILSKCVNDSIPRAALDLENTYRVYFSSFKDIGKQLNTMMDELKKWHDNLLNSTEQFDFSGRKAQEIFPLTNFSMQAQLLIDVINKK